MGNKKKLASRARRTLRLLYTYTSSLPSRAGFKIRAVQQQPKGECEQCKKKKSKSKCNQKTPKEKGKRVRSSIAKHQLAKVVLRRACVKIRTHPNASFYVCGLVVNVFVLHFCNVLIHS